jgi:sterol desaturase/sphingolipid hydroxylase (fatty acid hydroxylase superfamily)
LGALFHGAMMGTFLVMGRLFPRVEGQAIVNRDLVFNMVNGLVLFGFRVTVVTAIATSMNFGVLSTEWLQGPLLQGLLGFVLLDFSRYWLHYAGHRIPSLWQFHRVHHCAEVLDSSTGLRMHIVDFIQLSALPIFLFGVLLDTSVWHPAVLPVVLSVGVFFDTFQHANIQINPRSRWFRVWNVLFNNPLFHSWHHCRDGHLRDGNYGNTLIVWDRLFGTDVTGPEPPPLYGVMEGEALGNDPFSWQTLRTRSRTEA